MAHIVIDIRIRSLSESLLWSFSKDMAAEPLISPSDMFGPGLLVDLSHILFAVAQAASWPLCLHSSHKYCPVSSISIASSFRQEAHRALSAWSGILFQYGPHFILLISMFLM